jgi:uncharacterized protein YndB with AHSA1/START domain
VPDIDHELKIAATPEQVYAALTTPDGLRGWHAPTVTGSGEVGGEWTFAYADHPEFRWAVVESDAPQAVVWRCTEGPGDSVGTVAAFTIVAIDGRTRLELRHSGWPGTHGNFRKCNTTWGVLLHHLRDFVETGDAAPAFE